MSSTPKIVVLCAVIFTEALLGQTVKPVLLPAFKIEIEMSPSLTANLPKDQIKDDMELILRRNGLEVTDSAVQVLQLFVSAALSEDKERMAVDVKLKLLVMGFPIPVAMVCSGKPMEHDCWRTNARRVGLWDDDRLFVVGSHWPLEIRQNAKDLAEAFVLSYFRITQGVKK